MLGDAVPADDHISRYCAKRYVDGDRITGAAFQLRGPTEKRSAETYLSVNWLELLCCDSRGQEIAEIRKVLASKLTIHKRDRVAVGQVSTVLENVKAGSTDGRELKVLHEPEESPEDGDPSHSGIYGLRFDDELLYGELIAEMCQESYAAKEGV